VVTQSVLDLTAEVQRLTTTVSELESKVSGLEIISESLRIEVDSKDLLIEIANNQLEQSNIKVQETTTDLSNAIQKGIAEATQRVSLTARNESLLQENTLLKDQLFGKQAEIQEGAVVAEDFSVKVVEPKESFVTGLLYFARENANNGRDWINGPDIEIENFTATQITISVEISSEILNPERNANNQVSCNSLFNSIAQFTIGPNSKVTKNLTFKNGNGGDEARLNKLTPNTRTGRDRKYVGSIKFTSQQSGDGISLPITLRKQVGTRFTG
jgi:hypothetical protein